MSSTEARVLEFLRLRHGGQALTVEAFLARCPDPPADLETRLREAAAWTPGRVADAQRGADAVDEVDPTLLIPREAMGRRGDTGTVTSSEYHQRYEFVRQLGEGGFGVVHLVRDSHYNGELRALKVIRSEHTKEALLSRFRNEIVVLRALNHDGIPLIYNDGLTPTGEIYYTMTYVEGPTLREVLERGDPIPTERLVQWARQLLAILEYAHSRGVVHRDLKPSNIVLKGEGTEGESLQVLDFGIAKVVGREGPLADAQTLVTGVPIGTPDYMSPEQVTGEGIDGRTDIFSLGIILYQFCGGRLPFKGDTSFQSALARVSQRAKPLEPTEAPAWFASWIDRLLEKDAKERPTVGTALALLLDAVTVASKPRPRSRTIMLALAPLLLVGVVGYLGWEWSQDSDDAPSIASESTNRESSTPSSGEEARTPRSKPSTSSSSISDESTNSLARDAGPLSELHADVGTDPSQDPTNTTAPDSVPARSNPAAALVSEGVPEPVEGNEDWDSTAAANGGTEPSKQAVDESTVLALADHPLDPGNSGVDPEGRPPSIDTPGVIGPPSKHPGDASGASTPETGSPLDAVLQGGTDSVPKLQAAASQEEPTPSTPVLPLNPSEDSFQINFTRLRADHSESIESGTRFHTNDEVLRVIRTAPPSNQSATSEGSSSFETFMNVVVRAADRFHIHELPGLELPLTTSSPLELKLPGTGIYRIAVLSSDHKNLWYKERDESHLVATWTVHYEDIAPSLESELESEDQHAIDGDQLSYMKRRLIGTRTPTLVGSTHDSSPGELAALLYSLPAPKDSLPAPVSGVDQNSWETVKLNDDGTFRVPLSLPADRDRLQLELVSRDRAGNSRQHSIDIQVDLVAPGVTLERRMPGPTASVDQLELTEIDPTGSQTLSESPLTTQDEWIDLGFRMQDANPKEILLEGNPQPFEDEEAFQRHPLDLGLHQLRIVATDKVNNQRTYELNILRMPKPPTSLVYEVAATHSRGPLIASRAAEATHLDDDGIQRYRLDVPTVKPWAIGKHTNVRVTVESAHELELELGGERYPSVRHVGESQTFQLQLPQEEKTLHARLEARDHEGRSRTAAILDLSVYNPWQPDGFRADPEATLLQHTRFPSRLVHEKSGLVFVLVHGSPEDPWIYLSKNEVTWGMAEAVEWTFTPGQQKHLTVHSLEFESIRDHPVVFIHGESAIRLAAAFGASLPTFEEWLQGVRREPPELGSPLLGEGNPLDSSTAALSTTPDYEGHLTQKVGTHPADTSWCGLEDMVGNVSELIGDGCSYVGANVRSALDEQHTPAAGTQIIGPSNAHGIRLVLRCKP